MVPVMMTARLDFELFLSLFRGIDFVLVLLGASAEAGPGPARIQHHGLKESQHMM